MGADCLLFIDKGVTQDQTWHARFANQLLLKFLPVVATKLHPNRHN